jgi:N-acetylneuraminate synthase
MNARSRAATFNVGSRAVGDGAPCFVVAEAGVNHNGDRRLARRLIEAARDAGADAVKFQTFSADRLAAPDAPAAAYQRRSLGAAVSQRELLRGLELSEQDHYELLEHCQTREIQFLSTPFDEVSADFLVTLGVPALKVASGEITNLPFLAHLARIGRPMIVSTGMAHLHEVESAVACVRANGDPPLALLHCVSSYPAEANEANLRAMQTMAAAFGVPIGYSDHTLGSAVACAAVALGACIVEKHLTLDRSLPGPDHRASLEPAEFGEMVRGIRVVEQALGSGRKQPAASELETAAVARKSLFAACDLSPGTVLTRDLVDIRRPGTGLSPAALPDVIGRRVRNPLKAGTPLDLEMFEPVANPRAC